MKCDLEIPWGIRWSCQIIMLFISLGLRENLKSEVKNGSHQLTDRHWWGGWMSSFGQNPVFKGKMISLFGWGDSKRKGGSFPVKPGHREHKHVTTNAIKWSHHSPFSLDKEPVTFWKVSGCHKRKRANNNIYHLWKNTLIIHCFN